MKPGEEMDILANYLALDTGARIKFLTEYIKKGSGISEDFCLTALEKEKEPSAKWFLIKALGILRSTKAINALLKVSETPDSNFGHTTLYLITAWSLGRMGEAALYPTLQLLDRAEDILLKVFAVDALGEIGSENAIPKLEIMLKGGEDEVKLWSALALAKIGKASLPCLHKIVLSDQIDLKTFMYALDAIEKIGDVMSTPIILKIIKEGTEERKIGVLKLHSHWNKKAINTIKGLLESDNDQLRNMAYHVINLDGRKN